ncbi:MAG: GNAT family N-acetyltransferase, partial [Candidatus Sericytochromatia bacterium]
DPGGQEMATWSRWIAEARLPMLAGELNSHYGLLQKMGDVLPADDPVQVYCRYETQDFCVHDGSLPAVPESSLKLKQARSEDVDKLFHFYQRSETMQARSRGSLLYTIEHNRLFYLQKLGKIVSAALTHCESSDAGLIGGVYTPALHRGKGYGYLCVHALLAALKADGKTPCLFYEKNNNAARKLYQKLGFRPYGEWVLIELTYENQVTVNS